ncbi:hypothetical protein ACXYFN_00210 [Mycoplasma sp. 48589B]
MKFKRYFPMLLGATSILPMTVVACSNNSEDKSKIDELNKEIEKHKKDADDLLATKNGLEATLNEKEAKLTELNEKIDLLTKQLQDKITDDEKEQLNKQLLKDKATLENQINELNKEVKNHKDAKEQLTSELNEKTNAINELNQKIELLTKQKEDGDKSNKDALDKLDKEKKTLEAELKTQKTAKDELSNQLNEKNNSINELNKKVESLTKQLQSNTNETLEQLKRDKASLEAEIKSLRNNSHTSENGSKEYVLLKKIADFYKSDDKNAKLELNLNLGIKLNQKTDIQKYMVDAFKNDKETNNTLTSWYRENKYGGPGGFEISSIVFNVLNYLKDKNNESKVADVINTLQKLPINLIINSLAGFSDHSNENIANINEADAALLILQQYLMYSFYEPIKLVENTEKLPEYSHVVDFDFTNINPEEFESKFTDYVNYQNSIVNGYDEFYLKAVANLEQYKDTLSKKIEEIKNNYTNPFESQIDFDRWRNDLSEKVEKAISESYKDIIRTNYGIMSNIFNLYGLKELLWEPNITIEDIRETANTLPDGAEKWIPYLEKYIYKGHTQLKDIFRKWLNEKYKNIISSQYDRDQIVDKDSFIEAIRNVFIRRYKYYRKATDDITIIKIFGVGYEFKNPTHDAEINLTEYPELYNEFTMGANKVYNDSLHYFFTDFLTTDKIVNWSEIDSKQWEKFLFEIGETKNSNEEIENHLLDVLNKKIKEEVFKKLDTVVDAVDKLANESADPAYSIREKLNINIKGKITFTKENGASDVVLDFMTNNHFIPPYEKEQVEIMKDKKLKISDQALKFLASALEWSQRDNSAFSISISEK